MRKISFPFLFLIFWIILVSTGLYVYIFYLQPAKLGSSVSAYLREKTQLNFKIERINFSVIPSVSVTAENAFFYDKNQNIKIAAAKIEGELSWRSLFALKPVVKELTVINPVFEITVPAAQKDNAQAPADIRRLSQNAAEQLFSRLKKFSVPHYFNSSRLVIQNGSGRILMPQNDIGLFFKNFSASLRSPDLIDGYADISLEQFDIVYKNLPLIQLTDSKILAGDLSYNPRSYSGSLTVETNIQAASLQRFYDKPINKAYRFFPMPKPSFVRLAADFNLGIHSRKIALNGIFANKTLLPMNGYNTPISLTVPFSLETSFEKEKPVNLVFPAENAYNRAYRKAFLQENALSGYAVDLPGFYIKAVNIDKAEIKADTDEAVLSGKITGLYPLNPLFSGKVQAKKFSLPRWIGPTRNMGAGLYNALNNIKADMTVFCTPKGVFAPEITASVLNHRIKGQSVTANFLRPDICFDLEIQQNKNNTEQLNPLFPEINGKNVAKVSLPPAAVVTGNKPSKNSLRVDYHINISLPHKANIWKIDCSQTKVLVSPDKNETPTIAVSIGNLYTGTAKALATLNSGKKHEISVNIQKILLEAPARNIMGYTAINGRASANLKVKLDGNSLESLLNSLEISGNADIADGALYSKEKMLTKFNALSADIDVRTIPFKLSAKTDSFTLNGKWNLYGEFPQYNAKIRSKNSGIAFSLNSGVPFYRKPQNTEIELTEKPGKATILKGSTQFGYNLNDNKLIIQNYRGMLRNSKLIADLTVELKEKTTCYGKLYFQHFMLSDYMKSEPKHKKEDKDLPLDFICENNIDLAVKADKLTFYDVTTDNFTGNIKITDNKISVNNLKTRIRGGRIQALLEGAVSRHGGKYSMNTMFKMRADNIDMLSVSKMRKQKTLMAGTGNISIQGDAIVSRTSDILKNLNADWSMNFRNGYFQSRSESNPNQYSGKTPYSLLSASGTVHKGVANTNNIVLHGNGLDIVGGGSVDLVSEKINASAKANYLGISEIPIFITGSIDKPKYEVKVLNAVGSTLGSIGTGIFDIFNGVIIQPFKFFMQ